MHKRHMFSSCCTALLLLSASLAVAASREDGERAFQSGDYATAATRFEQAIVEGDDSNATRYNLAASYFRQGDTAKANSNFRLLFDQGFQTADVIYSLGVTEKLLGNTAAAVELFSTVAVNTSALADEALAQLEELGFDPVVAIVAADTSQLLSSVQVATGYNDAIVEVQDGKLAPALMGARRCRLFRVHPRALRLGKLKAPDLTAVPRCHRHPAVSAVPEPGLRRATAVGRRVLQRVVPRRLPGRHLRAPARGRRRARRNPQVPGRRRA